MKLQDRPKPSSKDEEIAMLRQRIREQNEIIRKLRRRLGEL